jgi:SAM-dependent methyltransferase
MKINLGEYITDKLRERFVRENLKALGEINFTLDLGCGNKPFEKYYNLNSKNHVGIDVEKTPHKNSKIDVFFDGKNIPFEDAKFDLIICTEVMEHVSDPNQFLLEINRVLKKEGTLILTVPFLQLLHEVPHDFHRFTPFALKNYLEKSGFQINKMAGAGRPFVFILSLIFRWPLKFWNRLSKICNFFFLRSIYNPFIFIFIFLPQCIVLLFSKIIYDEKKIKSKTFKTYCLIAIKK